MNETKMSENNNILEGKEEQLKGHNQKKRGKLIGDELEVIQGSTRILLGIIQEVYGMTKEEAEKKMREYEL